ncbi:MAG: ParB/RepB/Spo0J family partition protein, partial [Myxococcales bacterium]|nr:ParB/RepB/Spo0J family partition protein [Myxococcales bacterium]
MARRRLGRGLDGLLPAAPPASERSPKNTAAIEDLHPGHMQPRTRIDAEALAELSASIREHGVLEPILVRKRRSSGGFEIIAGERRWRAAQQAGLKEVPIFVHNLNDEAAFEAALVENLQREDLNPMETARAFQRLVDDYGYTQEAIATRVGKE